MTFGAAFGIGAMGYLGDHLGVRGDVRCLRTLGEPGTDDTYEFQFGKFSYWRGTAGLFVRF